jgi:hypothetical protein
VVHVVQRHLQHVIHAEGWGPRRKQGLVSMPRTSTTWQCKMWGGSFPRSYQILSGPTRPLAASGPPSSATPCCTSQIWEEQSAQCQSWSGKAQHVSCPLKINATCWCMMESTTRGLSACTARGPYPYGALGATNKTTRGSGQKKTGPQPRLEHMTVKSHTA